MGNHPQPPELNDRDWLAARYERDGDTQIARDLGVSRRTVRAARERLGIRSQPPGRRRGVSPTAGQLDATLDLFVATYLAERNTAGPAPSERLLAGRVAEASQARGSDDPDAFGEALIRLASAACLMHRALLRAA